MASSGFGSKLPRFGAVVVGDEPAGLWLLGRLAEARPFGDAPLLWISFAEPEPLAVPFFWGPRWGITVDGPWSAELRTPKRAFRWTERAVRERFPTVPPTVDLKRPEDRDVVGAGGSAKELERAVRELLDTSSDFSLVAKMVARAAFRARRPSPERAGLAALLWTELAWWRPAMGVPDTVDRWVFEHFPTVTTHTRSGDLHRFQLSNGAELETRLCVLNANERLLDRFFGPVGGVEKMLGYAAPRAPIASTSVTMTVAPGTVPAALSPLVVVADTETFPEEDRELWSMAVGSDMCTLRVDVATPPLVTDGTVADASRRTLERMRAMFPGFDRSVRAMTPTAPSELCDDLTHRVACQDAFEAKLQARYDQAAFRREGSVAGVEPLLPSFRCDLPYPLGTLLGAQEVLEKVTERKPRSSSRRTEAAPPEARP